MTHLPLALSHLQTQLPANWVATFSGSITSDDDSNQQNVLFASVTLIGVLDPVSSDLFDELNFSILTGEYIPDFGATRLELENIENYLTTLVANYDLPGFPNMTLVTQEVLTDAFLQPIRESLKRYRILIDFAERHLNYQPGTNTIFHIIKNDNISTKDVSSAATSGAKLFQINVGLAETDHGLSFHRDTFQDILFYKHELTTFGAPTITTDLLLKKAGYLLYKLTFRLQQKKVTYDYAIDFNYSLVSLIEVPEFEYWNNFIKGHYDDGIKPSEYDIFVRAALTEFDKLSPTLDLMHYHVLTKFFKDSSKDLSKLRRLRDLYETFYLLKVPTASIFDKKALEVTFCYIENNLLSAELEHNEFKLENWVEKFKKYTDRAATSKNTNFFPYFKIITEFLSPLISGEFAKETSDFKLIKSLISDYEKNLGKLLENTGICDNIDYLPFQLDFNNSLITLKDINGTNRKCFLSSSFVLPLDYKKRREDHEEYKNELTKFRTMYDIQYLLKKDRLDIQNMKADIERTDKRHIEILSIFAALVMFVSNEIQIFTKVTNIADAVVFTLFFAYGIGLFVLLIWFITRPEGLKWKSFSPMHIMLLALFISGLLYGIYYTQSSTVDEKTSKKSLHILDFRIDSLKRQKTIDSLKLLVQPSTIHIKTDVETNSQNKKEQNKN